MSRDTEDEKWLENRMLQFVSAVGTEEKGKYSLGFEADGCLRDLKKWLVNFDHRLNRFDVANILSETKLVTSDLPWILAEYEQGRVDEKLALHSLELLVLLTWPINLNPLTATENQYYFAPMLRRALKKYKRAILNHPSHAVFKAGIRIATALIRKPTAEISQRDWRVINLPLLLVRNLLNIDARFDETDIDRSATILELENQKFLSFITLLGSNVSRKFSCNVLDCLWGLLNGVDVSRLMGGKAEYEHQHLNLAKMLKIEKKMKNSRFKPSRHTRFGTMIAMKDDNEALTVHGQRAILNDLQTLKSIDDSKTWRAPARSGQNNEVVAWELRMHISYEAGKVLVPFVNSFLDAGFNPLFTHLRGLVSEFEQKRASHYVWLMGWFMNAERLRTPDPDFKLVGSALSYNSFVIVASMLANAIEVGPSQHLGAAQACVYCLRAIFLMTESMSKSKNEDWRDTAENIKSRLFYDEARLDTFPLLTRVASRPTANASLRIETVELVHVLLRLLEAYTEQHSIVFVKSKRQKKHDDGDESEDEEHKTRERKWNFALFLKKFNNEATIEMYQRALSDFGNLDRKILKHILMFFQMLFVKREMTFRFYRLSFIHLLLRVVDAKDGIQEPTLAKPYSKFLNFYAGRLAQALEEHPSLYVEMLFRKNREDEQYYEHGLVGNGVPSKTMDYDYDFQTEGLSAKDQFAIAVAAIHEAGLSKYLDWIIDSLSKAAEKQSVEPKRRLLTEERTKLREAIQKPLIRLLFKLIGLEYNMTTYFVPASLSSVQLIEACELIESSRKELTDTDPYDFLKKLDKNQVDGDTSSDSESDAGGGFDDPRLQPLSKEELAAKKRAKREERQRLKKSKKQKRPRSSSDAGSDLEGSDGDQTLGPQLKKRSLASKQRTELEKQKKIKSAVFVDSSDDEDLEERDRMLFEHATSNDAELPTADQVRRRTGLFVSDED